jgi:ferrous iron transport protein B
LFKIAIAGCANVGKTSLFNLLTGKKNKIGNWEGVTVDISNAKMLFAKEIYIFDLPGIVSLEGNCKTLDQVKSREFLFKEEIDLIVNVVSLEHLKRDLQLTIELYELGKPIIVVVQNNKGLDINLELLNLEFINLNFRKKGVMRDLINKIKTLCGSDSHKLQDPMSHCKAMGYKIKVVENNLTDTISRLDNDQYRVVKEARLSLVEKAIGNIDINHKRTITDTIDSFVMNKFLAIPIFISVICLMLLLTIVLGDIFKGYFELWTDQIIINPISEGLKYLEVPSSIVNIFQYGIGTGIRIVASFIPLLFILYVSLGIIDESGYMSRASISIGKIASKVGLTGKSIIPLIIGFGCNVPAIMGARIIENEKHRLFTIILIPFMSCGARLTLFALFAGVFFHDNKGLFICSLYFFSIFLAMIVAIVLQPYFKPQANKETEQTLPRYRLPRLTVIVRHTVAKIKHFIVDTGKTITIMSIGLYLLSSLPSEVLQFKFNNIILEEKIDENSLLVHISKKVSYIFEPIGISQENWPATVSLVTGIIAKEVVASTLLTLYEIKEDDLIDQQTLLNKYFGNSANAFAYILFVLIYFPCITVFSVMKKEVGIKVAIYSSIFYTILAYVVAGAFHKISIYFHGSIVLSLTSLIVMILLISVILRKISSKLKV